MEMQEQQSFIASEMNVIQISNQITMHMYLY